MHTNVHEYSKIYHPVALLALIPEPYATKLDEDITDKLKKALNLLKDKAEARKSESPPSDSQMHDVPTVAPPMTMELIQERKAKRKREGERV